MTHKEIFDLEERNKDNLYTIYLHQNGNFLRAYEWSAYLCSVFPLKSVDVDVLKPNKRKSKINKDGIINVGFPSGSISKFLPEIYLDLLSFNENCAAIDCREIFKDNTITDYKEILSKWKNDVQFKVDEGKNNELENKANNNIDVVSFSDLNNAVNVLLNQVKGSVIDDNTKIEVIAFLSDNKIEAIKVVRKNV